MEFDCYRITPVRLYWGAEIRHQNTNLNKCFQLLGIWTQTTRKGYIAFAFTHADAFFSTFGGKRVYFGANPICIAAPREEAEPFCLDMAPNMISWNKLLGAREKGESLS